MAPITIEIPNKKDNQIVVNIENKTSVQDDLSKASPEVTEVETDPLTIKEADEINFSSDVMDDVTNQNIPRDVEEIDKAITAVEKAQKIVKNNSNIKEATDESIKVALESFEEVTKIFSLDNSYNECVSISQEDDLPPMGRMANVLATIKRWILAAIKFIKNKLKDIYRWAKEVFRSSDKLVYAIKKNILNTDKKLQEFLRQNAQYKDIMVSWDRITKIVNFKPYPVLKYVGVCDSFPVGYLDDFFGYCTSGELFTTIYPRIKGELKLFTENPNGGLNIENSRWRQLAQRVCSEIFSVKTGLNKLAIDTIDELYKDVKIKETNNSVYFPLAFSSDRVLILTYPASLIDTEDDTTTDDEFKLEEYQLPDIEFYSKIKDIKALTLEDVSKTVNNIGKVSVLIENRVDEIKNWTDQLNKNFEFVIDELEVQAKETQNRDTAGQIGQNLKDLNKIVKPLIHIAPYKWISFNLKFIFGMAQFYTELAKAIQAEAASSIKTESSYGLSDHTIAALSLSNNTKRLKDYNPEIDKTDWSSVLGNK